VCILKEKILSTLERKERAGTEKKKDSHKLLEQLNNVLEKQRVKAFFTPKGGEKKGESIFCWGGIERRFRKKRGRRGKGELQRDSDCQK